MKQRADLSGSNWVLLDALLRLLRSQYGTTEQEVLVVGPAVYQQLLERMPHHLLTTHQARQASAGQQAGQRRSPRTAAQQQQQQQQAEEQQQREDAQKESVTLLELHLHRLLGRPVAWVAPDGAEQEAGPWPGCPPSLIVFLVSSSKKGSAAAAAAVAAANEKLQAQRPRRRGVRDAEQEQQGSDDDDEEEQEAAAAGSGSEGGCSDGFGSDDDCGDTEEQEHADADTAAVSDDKHEQQQQQQQQQKQQLRQQQQQQWRQPRQEHQHLSLLLLHNAEGLGRAAALNAKERKDQARELKKKQSQQEQQQQQQQQEQQQEQEQAQEQEQEQEQEQHQEQEQEQQQEREQELQRLLPVTRLVHLDPHGLPPWPCCCRATRHGIVPCSDDVTGPAAAVVAAPLLAFLEAALQREGRDRKAATGQAAGRPSALMTVQLTNPESPEPQLQLLAGALPPLPHVCRHQPGAVCLCQGSVLAALDWLLASPPDDATLEARQRGSDSAHLLLPLSPAWYPAMYSRLLSEQLGSVAQRLLDKLPQDARRQQQQQQQQQEQEQLQGQAAPAEPQLSLDLPSLQTAWQEAQQERDRQCQLCYPGPMAHLQLLEVLQKQACEERFIDPLLLHNWGEGCLEALMFHVKS
ncbi:hypothetical protein OEZ85_010090 [Tetradesmus obliquus]|uniref:Uncharacterized protein n=1 Tax=Tetradesmus obliquus TaxID=3088 RepID=A0ABY8TNH2_TETOB|nr:hypothetical protein OEZ85_010090 [Tetradesmus obliquus]